MKLMFVTKTRPDIKFMVIALSTRMEKPKEYDKMCLNQIIGYLKGTIDFGLTLKPNGFQIQGESDASFGVHIDGRGHTGGICMIGNSLFRVETSKQPIVGKSSTECELIASNKIVEEIIWLKECWKKWDSNKRQ